MKLKDLSALWGIPIVHLREHSKKYRLSSAILYLCDIAVVTILTAFMYQHNISYGAYGFVLVAICLIVHFVSYSKLNPDKFEAFKFYKKHLNCEVKEVSYSVNSERLYSVLYCAGYMRLKKNCSYENYKELILSACCENIKYSKSLMKYLKKYEDESGNLTCIIIEKGKKQYFIDFKHDSFDDSAEVNEETDSDSIKDGGSENESDN